LRSVEGEVKQRCGPRGFKVCAGFSLTSYRKFDWWQTQYRKTQPLRIWLTIIKIDDVVAIKLYF